MGLLIGKRGSTLSNIKKTSGAKVDIDDKEKVLWLGGSEREMEKAVRMIREVMSGKGGVRGSYVCCKAQLGANARGCVSRTGHVTDTNFMDSKDLVTTTEMDRPGKVFALDCEMVKSARGGELARVTILDFSGNICYDTLVKPPVPIGDYRTKFSGITQEMLEGVTITLKEVQTFMLKMISAQDIIVGHSLDNDLKVLHLEHRKVVDTSVVFPHQDGPPKKKSLRKIAMEVLNRKIQADSSSHDSKEDALAALDLVKVKAGIV